MDKEYEDFLLKHGYTEIIICPECKGKGFEWHDVGTHTSDFKSKLCSKCDGEGKVIELTLNISNTYKITEPKLKKCNRKR